MIPAHFIAIAIGFFLDRLIGDPPKWPHPVRWIGTLITQLTTRFNKGKNRTLKGAITLIITVIVVFSIVFVLVEFAYSLHLLVGIAIESLLIAVGLAQKSLRDAAMDVYNPLIAGEISDA
ncbi:cobalamin biosynthesis protein, partial [Microvirga sp. 3-52]|nr:cobalamin biosynthesis protein [Microvirga sp. 3-52]